MSWHFVLCLNEKHLHSKNFLLIGLKMVSHRVADTVASQTFERGPTTLGSTWCWFSCVSQCSLVPLALLPFLTVADMLARQLCFGDASLVAKVRAW